MTVNYPVMECDVLVVGGGSAGAIAAGLALALSALALSGPSWQKLPDTSFAASDACDHLDLSNDAPDTFVSGCGAAGLTLAIVATDQHDQVVHRSTKRL